MKLNCDSAAEIAAKTRGWHFADACMLRGQPARPSEMKKMLASALEYAEDEAKKAKELFNKKKASAAFRMAFQNHPRVS